MKNKILNWIYVKYNRFFYDKVLNSLPTVPIDLEKIYVQNQYFFELRLLKEFTGYIPNDVNAPVLKAFEEYGEQFERWVLWQSWYINQKVINDPKKIELYQGMMLYLKVLYVAARNNKKTTKPPAPKEDVKVETPWIDTALADISSFKEDIKKRHGKDNSDTRVKTSETETA